MATSELQVIATQVKEMIHKEFISESSGLSTAPVILVRNKDGSWIVSVDSGRLNSILKKTPIRT